VTKPFLANINAVSRPIPLELPVMTATLCILSSDGEGIKDYNEKMILKHPACPKLGILVLVLLSYRVTKIVTLLLSMSRRVNRAKRSHDILAKHGWLALVVASWIPVFGDIIIMIAGAEL
jgi:hypothetical protein